VCGHPRPRIEGTHAGYINGRGHRTLKIELFVSHPRARHETKNNLAVLARTLVLVMCEENNAMPGRVHVIASRPSSYGEPQPTGTCGRRNRQSSPIVCNDRKDLAVDHLKRIGEISVRLTARRIRRIVSLLLARNPLAHLVWRVAQSPPGLAIAARLSPVAAISDTTTTLRGTFSTPKVRISIRPDCRACRARRTCVMPSDEIASHADILPGPRVCRAEARGVSLFLLFGRQTRERMRTWHRFDHVGAEIRQDPGTGSRDETRQVGHTFSPEEILSLAIASLLNRCPRPLTETNFMR
jgi:hypothetical protein